MLLCWSSHWPRSLPEPRASFDGGQSPFFIVPQLGYSRCGHAEFRVSSSQMQAETSGLSQSPTPISHKSRLEAWLFFSKQWNSLGTTASIWECPLTLNLKRKTQIEPWLLSSQWLFGPHANRPTFSKHPPSLSEGFYKERPLQVTKGPLTSFVQGGK